jgi:hypothetical protein
MNLKLIDKTVDTVDYIFGYKANRDDLNGTLRKLSDAYDLVFIYNYLEQNKDFLHKIMRRNFSSEHGKMAYFYCVLKNNLKDFNINKEEVKKQIEYNAPIITNYKPKKRKKSIVEYEQEIGGNNK